MGTESECHVRDAHWIVEQASGREIDRIDKYFDYEGLPLCLPDQRHTQSSCQLTS
jgi:hypothetical protein